MLKDFKFVFSFRYFPPFNVFFFNSLFKVLNFNYRTVKCNILNCCKSKYLSLKCRNFNCPNFNFCFLKYYNLLSENKKFQNFNSCNCSLIQQFHVYKYNLNSFNVYIYLFINRVLIIFINITDQLGFLEQLSIFTMLKSILQ